VETAAVPAGFAARWAIFEPPERAIAAAPTVMKKALRLGLGDA
jgi:hypothetical protein